MRTRENSLVSIIMTGLFAAIIYLGVLVLRIPVPALVGRPFIHFGNTLTAVAILYLGYRNGMLAGIIGLGGFDLLNGYAATSWLTMLEVVVVASVLTAVYKGMHYQDSKKNIIISGQETHVCVFQTARDLMDAGYNVFLLSDAVTSRSDFNSENALQLLRHMGARVVNLELVIFDILHDSKHPCFKEAQALIK